MKGLQQKKRRRRNLVLTLKDKVVNKNQRNHFPGDTKEAQEQENQ